jgi:F-type H+-transporting ATPase subunit gamma
MAKARQIIKRRKSVQNIRKITRTMQLVATARFQQAFSRAVASRPYTQKITQLVGQLAESQGQISHPLMTSHPEAAQDMLLAITSNRGLCGAYNSSVLHATMTHLRATPERTTELHCVGKKGIGYFKFLRRPLAAAITIGDRPRFDQVEALADQMIAAYNAGRYGRILISYMRFYSAGRQRPEIIQLLPIAALVEAKADEAGNASGAGAGPTHPVEYDFSPAPAELLAALLPQTVKVRLFQCFTDAAVSEQVARMVAMKSATDAAGDMIRDLTRRYNRARQSQITLELLDIVGGAEALA